MDKYSLYQQELLRGEYHPKVVAYYFKQWDSYQMPYHIHNAVEIMYVINGKCVVDLDKNIISLKKGDFILIDANVAHKLIVEDGSPCKMLNIEFTFTDKKRSVPSIRELVMENNTFAQFLSMGSPYLLLKDTSEVYHILKSLVLEMDEKEPEKELMVQLLFSQLFIRLARLAGEVKENASPQTNSYVKQTINYLHQQYDCEIQIKDIASAVNLHPGYLHRIFKKHMGCTVMEYLTALRIEKAKMLLAYTDIPVISISDYIGINSRQYFSFLFKKHTSQTPCEFRESAANKVKTMRSEQIVLEGSF